MVANPTAQINTNALLNLLTFVYLPDVCHRYHPLTLAHVSGSSLHGLRMSCAWALIESCMSSAWASDLYFKVQPPNQFRKVTSQL